jgi:multicomponent Na+:H+ antiporter subunit C
MIVYATALMLVLIGIYTLIARENLIKKIIGLMIFTNGIHLLLISLGYRFEGIPAIMSAAMYNANFQYFVQHAVDPLPQALVVTSIVINLSVMAVALALIVQVHQKVASLNGNELRSMRE